MQQRPDIASVPEFFAVEEVQATLPGCTQEFLQMTPGKLDYRLTRLEYPNLRLFRERTNKTLLKRVAQGGELLFFSLPARSEGACRVEGHAFAHHVALMTDARQPVELITPSSMELLYLVVDRRWFALHAVQQGLPGLTERLRGQRAFALPPDGLARFVATLTALFDAPPAPAPDGGAETPILLALLHLLAGAQRVDQLAETRSKRMMDSARDLFLLDRAEAPRLSAVAAELGISRRYLQTCFQESAGMTATELLRAERLNQVRGRLIAGRQSARPVSIGDVAADYGFWHLSRFAGDYRKLFGELPSQTLGPRRPE
ncbi:MAG: helix-turn-helix transcriptional regulator [Paracoccus aminovorans]|nr:helix-turn-helix transcriptional regulator [Paracoccus aminovorans]